MRLFHVSFDVGKLLHRNLAGMRPFAYGGTSPSVRLNTAFNTGQGQQGEVCEKMIIHASACCYLFLCPPLSLSLPISISVSVSVFDSIGYVKRTSLHMHMLPLWQPQRPHA